MSFTVRRAARAIILTPDNEVLLMRMAFPWQDEDLWILPGGGIEPGESERQAVEREIYEETGASGLLVRAAVWEREFLVEATSTLMKQCYFLAHAARFVPQATALLGNEQNWLREYRWWSLDALLAAADLNVEPTNIARGIEHLISNGLPEQTIQNDHL